MCWSYNAISLSHRKMRKCSRSRRSIGQAGRRKRWRKGNNNNRKKCTENSGDLLIRCRLPSLLHHRHQSIAFKCAVFSLLFKLSAYFAVTFSSTSFRISSVFSLDYHFLLFNSFDIVAAPSNELRGKGSVVALTFFHSFSPRPRCSTFSFQSDEIFINKLMQMKN